MQTTKDQRGRLNYNWHILNMPLADIVQNI